MARAPKPRWHKGNQLWVSDVGEPYTDAKGRPRRRTVSFPGIPKKDPARARKALEDLLAEREARERSGSDPTVTAIFELYLEWVEANREPSTFEGAARHLGKFAAWPCAGGAFGARRASSLHPEDLERVLDEMGRFSKPSYVRLFHAHVMAAFAWSARRIRGRVPPTLIAAHPFAGVKAPKLDRTPDRYASRDELAAFLRWAWRHGARPGTQGRETLEWRFGRQLCLLLRVLAHTGARPGELTISGRVVAPGVGFTWDKWEPDAFVNALGQRVGRITHAKHKTSRKTGRAREVIVPPILVRALERHRARPWSHPHWVFTHRRGTGAEKRGATTAAHGEPWTSASLGMKLRRWRAAAFKAGVPIQDVGADRFVAYRLRHTKATDLVRGGMSHDQAAALLGTSGRMIETTYSHMAGSRLAELDGLARKRGGK